MNTWMNAGKFLPKRSRFSLLEPPEYSEKRTTSRSVDDSADADGPKYARLDPTASDDLGYSRILREMVTAPKREEYILDKATLLCRDPEFIAYRLDILEDLMRIEQLRTCFEELLEPLLRLAYYVNHPGKQESTALQETVWRLRELEYYVLCVDRLHAAMAGKPVRSEGMLGLRRVIDRIRNEDAYVQLTRELPRMLGKINDIRGITIGVNLNEGLVPLEAVLLSVNDRPFGGTSFLDKMVAREGSSGIGRLHSAVGTEYAANPTLLPLFKDLSVYMEKAIKPLSHALGRFAGFSGSLLVNLRDEILFYLGGVRLIERLRERGLPMIRPEILSEDDRSCWFRGLYNIDLALGDASGGEIVPNDFEMGPEGRIFILTGPNRGGKTTFLQALGLAQILFQVGLYVPASDAALSVCDTVLTHYPALEDPGKHTGRFGEEAERLHEMFRTVTGRSLLLLNESLSSTAFGEARYLAQDLVGVMRTIGVRAVYATHIFELAADAEAINADVAGDSRVVSLIAGVDRLPDGTIRPNFRISAGPPTGRSYAAELARKYGIDRERLLRMTRKEQEPAVASAG